jgi:hypothetical protein
MAMMGSGATTIVSAQVEANGKSTSISPKHLLAFF